MVSPLTTSPEKIELSNFKLNKTGHVITLSLMYLMIVLPILAFILIIASGNKPAFGLVLFSIALGFGAYFFYRLATWNKFGKEIFILEKEVLIYQPEAKKISYRTIEFKIETLVVSIITVNEYVDYEGAPQAISWLKLDDGQTNIQTNIKSPRIIMDDLVKIFEEWGIKNNLLLDEIKD
jgi:hypothetical protein